MCGNQKCVVTPALHSALSDASSLLRDMLAAAAVKEAAAEAPKAGTAAKPISLITTIAVPYDDAANFDAFIHIAVLPQAPLEASPPPSWAGVLHAARSLCATKYWYDRCWELVVDLVEDMEDVDLGVEIEEGSGAAVLSELSQADVSFVCSVDGLYRPAWRDAGCASDGYAAMMAFVTAPAGSGRVFVDDEREDLVLSGSPHLVAAARAAGELRTLLCMHRKMGATADEDDSNRCIHQAAWDQLDEAECSGDVDGAAAIRECFDPRWRTSAQPL